MVTDESGKLTGEPDGQINRSRPNLPWVVGVASVHYGFNVRAEWKGFDLSIATFGAAGFKAVDFVDLTLHSSLGALNRSTDLLNAYNSEADAAINGLPVNINTNVPRISNKPGRFCY